MNPINFSFNVDGSRTFSRPLLPSDSFLFSAEAYNATWSAEEVWAANEYGPYGGAYGYATRTIIAPADGNYDFTVTGATGFSQPDSGAAPDTQIWLYTDSFDPLNPLFNLVAANEDINAFGEGSTDLLSKLSSVTLLAGTTYVLVVSSRDAYLTGTAQVSFSDAALPTAPTQPSSGAPDSSTTPDNGAAPEQDQVVIGSERGDTLMGGSGNDIFTPAGGHDVIMGGAGRDIVQLSGHVSDYTMKVVGGAVVMSGINGNTVAMHDIEALSFVGGRGHSPSELVASLYNGVLGREGSLSEIDYWTAVLSNGGSAKDVASGFVTSNEAGALFRVSGSSGFVTGLYESFLGRTPDASEVAYWVGCINNGYDRADVALGFINSNEYQSKPLALELGSSNLGGLVRLYHTMLDRAPDEGGLNYWLAMRDAGTSMRTIADGFTQAAEAAGTSDSAFIDRIYQGGLHRDPSAAEKTQMLDLLAHGHDRGQLLLQVSESQEAIAVIGVVGSTVDLF